jgi:hypothetical protein
MRGFCLTQVNFLERRGLFVCVNDGDSDGLMMQAVNGKRDVMLEVDHHSITYDVVALRLHIEVDIYRAH